MILAALAVAAAATDGPRLAGAARQAAVLADAIRRAADRLRAPEALRAARHGILK